MRTFPPRIPAPRLPMQRVYPVRPAPRLPIFPPGPAPIPGRPVHLGDWWSDVTSWFTGPSPFQTTNPSEDDAKNQAMSLLQQLQQANQNIIALEDACRQSPAVAQAIGAQVIQVRQQYTDLATKYTRGYALLFGTAPDGLMAIPVAAVVAAVAIFAVIAAGIVTVNRFISVLQQQAQTAQQTAQNQTTLVQQAGKLQQSITDAAARGDWQTVQALQQSLTSVQSGIQSTAPQPKTDFAAWFENNWGMVAAAVAGIVVLPRLL